MTYTAKDVTVTIGGKDFQLNPISSEDATKVFHKKLPPTDESPREKLDRFILETRQKVKQVKLLEEYAQHGHSRNLRK